MRQTHFNTIILFTFFSLFLIAPFQGQQISAVQKEPDVGEKHGVRLKNLELEKLFERLKNAPGEARARSIEADIWQYWSKSGVSSIDKLMRQAKLLALRGHYAPSLGLLDRVIYEQPQYTEGWNRRATVLFFMMRDKESLVAITRVLELEPRHFGALAGKAMINIRAEQWGEALLTLRRAVKIHPYLKERHLIKFLEKKLKLRDL